jgi:hypothetical protein
LQQDRINEKYESEGLIDSTLVKKTFLMREARIADALKVQALFNTIYGGKYPLEFGSNVEILKGEIADTKHYLWIVTEDAANNELIGAMMFAIDLTNRMAKAGGGVVTPEYRKFGLASTMLKKGVHYLTETVKEVDVLYGTSRTVSEGPSRMVAEADFKKMGFFPNAVQIEDVEHLNLDVYLTQRALDQRRQKPYLFAPFYDIHKIARKQIGLERAYLVTEREPLKLSGKKLRFEVIQNEKTVIDKFRVFSEQKRISNSFFPFHSPNWLLSSEDGGSDVFIWYGGVGKQASILGFRTDHVNIHDMLDSVAITLQRSGATYCELLVDAYDYTTQQEAYTAKYIPSAYFPAMRLANDGLRDDYFVVSRTFQVLDFTSSWVMSENYPYLQAYMRSYNDLYIQAMHRTHLGGKKKPT